MLHLQLLSNEVRHLELFFVATQILAIWLTYGCWVLTICVGYQSGVVLCEHFVLRLTYFCSLGS